MTQAAPPAGAPVLPAAQAWARVDSAVAAVAPPLPTVAGADPAAHLPDLPVPEHLHVRVADPLGDWSLDVHRDGGNLNLLFSGHGSLADVVSAASPELHELVRSHGHALGTVEFQQGESSTGGDGSGRYGSGAPEHGAGDPSRPDDLPSRAPRLRSTPAAPRGPAPDPAQSGALRGLRLDKLA